jgi:hypothetical protein
VYTFLDEVDRFPLSWTSGSYLDQSHSIALKNNSALLHLHKFQEVVAVKEKVAGDGEKSNRSAKKRLNTSNTSSAK